MAKAGHPAASLIHVPAGGLDVIAGKLYEAWVLTAYLASRRMAGQTVTFVPGAGGHPTLTLRAAGGPISVAYPHFELDGPRGATDVWTDIWFRASSAEARHSLPGPESAGDFHELDVVDTLRGTVGKPVADDLLLGIECKARVYTKQLLREILGVRLELSVLVPAAGRGRPFQGRMHGLVAPEARLVVACTDASVHQYASPGRAFGVDFLHVPLP